MDDQDLIQRIKAANPDFQRRLASGLLDVQYDAGADVLYVALGEPAEGLSIPLAADGEDIYLRTDDDYKILGFDILHFRSRFLPRHPDGAAACGPLFAFFGEGDWRLQVAVPDREPEALYAVPSQAPLNYFKSYLPTIAPELALA